MARIALSSLLGCHTGEEGALRVVSPAKLRIQLFTTLDA